ncbi:exodeoxyribonuclease III [Hydrogenimonas sp.]
MGSISVCTFNVNSIRSRVELILRWLNEKRPVDILCFQEIKCEAAQFPAEAFESLGYHVAVNGQKRLNGVAICSKLPLEDVKTRFGVEILDGQKRLIEAVVGETAILNCYVPRGGEEGSEPHTYKMAFYDALRDYAEGLLRRHEKVLLLGDFNVALEDQDVYDPDVFEGAVGFLPSEKEKLRALMAAGLGDCFRRLHPDERAFTWWDYRTAAIWRDEGMRLDYLLASEGLCRELQAIDVDLWTRRRRSPTPSDHAPVVATFGSL